MRNWITLVESGTGYPAVLSGDDLVRYVVSIDGLKRTDPAYVEAIRDDLGERTARLTRVPLDSLEEPGVDFDSIEGMLGLTTSPPPIVIVDGEIYEGNHRVAVAKYNGEHDIAAYVVEAAALREGLGWETEIETSYPQFAARYEDHHYGNEDLDVPGMGQYLDYAHEIAASLAGEVLYRGIKAPLSVLEGDGPLGIHWSRDWNTARDFSASGWSVYDERFSKQGKLADAKEIIFAIAPVHPDQTNIVETVTVTIAGGENEVCMKQGQPVKIIGIYINRVGPIEDHPIVGTTRHT